MRDLSYFAADLGCQSFFAPISFTAHLLEILIYHLFDTSQDNDKMTNQSQQSINSPLSSLLSNMFLQIYSLQMKFG